MHKNINRKVCDQLGGSDHKSVIISIKETGTPLHAVTPEHQGLTITLEHQGHTITLEHQGHTITGKSVANAFTKGYNQTERDTKIPSSLKKEVRSEERD